MKARIARVFAAIDRHSSKVMAIDLANDLRYSIIPRVEHVAGPGSNAARHMRLALAELDEATS